MARWIASYISPSSDATPWIEGHGVIKKHLSTFNAKFRWVLIRYRLFPSFSDNMLTQEGVALVSSLITEYAIDFLAILQHEIYNREVGETKNLPFHCLIQRLFYEASVSEISRVNKKVRVIATTQTKNMKDLVHLFLPKRSSDPVAVRRAQTKVPSISTKPSDLHRGDVGIIVDFEIEKLREAKF